MFLRELAAGYIRTDALRAQYAAIRSFLAQEPPDAIIALRLGRDQRYLLCVCACMELGLTFLPLGTSWPQSRVEQIRLLTGFSRLIDELALEDIIRRTPPAEVSPGRALAPDLALYVLCTSGSTGCPKAVVVTRGAFESFLRAMDSNVPELGPRSRILAAADFTFDMSLIDIGLTLLKRCAISFSQSQGDPFLLAQEISAWRPGFAVMVPHQLGLLLDDRVFGKADFSSLRHLQLGGSRFFEALYDEAFAKLPGGIALSQCYGPTEATVYTHFKRFSGDRKREIVDGCVSIGRPLSGVSCAVVDEGGGRVSSSSTSGELWLGGPQVMRGYLGDDESTRRCIVERDGIRWYRTGDVGFFDDGGDYYVTGRMDETLKRSGFRVNLQDIDSYLMRLDCVRDCVTVAVPDPRRENLLVSYIVASRPVSEQELRAAMSRVLVKHQMPDRVEVVDRLPVVDSGKIARRELARKLRERS